jgi:hypothetical protein
MSTSAPDFKKYIYEITEKLSLNLRIHRNLLNVVKIRKKICCIINYIKKDKFLTKNIPIHSHKFVFSVAKNTS